MFNCHLWVLSCDGDRGRANCAFTLIDTDTDTEIQTETCNNGGSYQYSTDILYPCLSSSWIRCVSVSLLVSMSVPLVAVADLGGERDAYPSLGPFFSFSCVSAKTMSNNRLASDLWGRCPTSGKSWIRHWVRRGRWCLGNQRRHCRRQCYATCSLRCAVYLTSQDRLWVVTVAGGVVGGSRLGELLCLESGIDEFDSREQCLNAGCFWENITSVCCCSEYQVCTVVWNWEIEECLQTKRGRKRKQKCSLIKYHGE